MTSERQTIPEWISGETVWRLFDYQHELERSYRIRTNWGAIVWAGGDPDKAWKHFKEGLKDDINAGVRA